MWFPFVSLRLMNSDPQIIRPSFFLLVCSTEKRKLLHKASSCQFKKRRLTEMQRTTCIKTSSVPTQPLISFHKAKTSDPAPQSRIALTCTVYKILKASPRKWLHFFFFYPIAKDIFNHCLCQRGKERGHFCES